MLTSAQQFHWSQQLLPTIWEKIPAGLFLFCHNFVKKQLLFTQTGRVLEQLMWLLEGREGSVISLLAQCASWKGKISHSGAFGNRDSFGCCPGLAGTWQRGQHTPGCCS